VSRFHTILFYRQKIVFGSALDGFFVYVRFFSVNVLLIFGIYFLMTLLTLTDSFYKFKDSIKGITMAHCLRFLLFSVMF